jgi:copper chaperone NosL
MDSMKGADGGTRGVERQNMFEAGAVSRLVRLLPLLLTVFYLACSPPAGAVPAGAKMGRCPVCGMMVNATDNWASEIYFKDGTKIVFESPADMMKFYSYPADYKASPAQCDRSNIERISVKDYGTKQTIDGETASFVYKSKVEGPMGQDFLPFGKPEDAQAFVTQNGGQIVGLKDVTREMVDELRKS